MDKLLVALVPYGNAGWQWLILENDQTKAYRAQAGDNRIFTRSPINMNESSFWTETADFNYMTALTFENAKKEIRRAFKPISTCMFNVRNKECLIRLLRVYEELIGCPDLQSYWGKPDDAIGVSRNFWWYKRFGKQGSLPLGPNLPKACDYVRERIMDIISLNPTLTPQRIVNEEWAALRKDKFNQLVDLPFSDKAALREE